MPKNIPRFALITLMSFLSGLPLMLTNSTLQAWATSRGLSLMEIGLLTLVGMPYAYKFLWAPLLDRYHFWPFHGLRRSWILVASSLLAICVFCLSRTHLPYQLTWFITFALLTTFMSATMDIAIDAYRIEFLSKEEYALGNAYYVSAYRIAMLVSGGLASIIAGYVGWQKTYFLMALLIFLCGSVIYFAPEPLHHNQPHIPRKWSENIIQPIKDLLSHPHIFLILAFVLLYKFGEGLGTSLTSAFLLRQLHFSLAIVGSVYKTASLLATIAGSFLGGILYKRLNMFKSLLYFGAVQAFGVIFYIVLAKHGQQNLPLMVATLSTEAFAAAMSTTVFIAFLMQLCNPQFTATQFAVLSALPAMDRIFTGPIASFLVEHAHWTGYFFISFLSCWPALILLIALKRYIIEQHEH